MEDSMNLEALKKEKEKLYNRIYEIDSIINKTTKRTADGYTIELGVPYYYQSMASKRKVLVFDENARFGVDTVWVKENKHLSSGYYYNRLYKEQYPKLSILGL